MATVHAILDATEQLLTQQNLRDLTTRDVALRAGVSIGTLYQYFPSKEAILNEMVDRRANRGFERFRQSIALWNDLPLGDVLARLIHLSLLAQGQYPTKLRLVWDTIADQERVRERRQTMTQLFADFLASRPERLAPENIKLASWSLVLLLQTGARNALHEHPEAIEDGSALREFTLLACRYLGIDPPSTWPDTG